MVSTKSTDLFQEEIANIMNGKNNVMLSWCARTVITNSDNRALDTVKLVASQKSFHLAQGNLF